MHANHRVGTCGGERLVDVEIAVGVAAAQPGGRVLRTQGQVDADLRYHLLEVFRLPQPLFAKGIDLEHQVATHAAGVAGQKNLVH